MLTGSISVVIIRKNNIKKRASMFSSFELMQIITLWLGIIFHSFAQYNCFFGEKLRFVSAMIEEQSFHFSMNDICQYIHFRVAVQFHDFFIRDMVY